MLDEAIIELYFKRDEDAISESRLKYGAMLSAIAMNILRIREDAEECVSDTYLAAWDRMPPERPASLRAFLGRITRNLSISRFRKNRAQKRYDAMETLLSELTDCVPSPEDVARTYERRELAAMISRWLDTRSEDDRALFVRRYWYGESVTALAAEKRVKPNLLSQKLLRLRRALRAALEKEGVTNEE